MDSIPPSVTDQSFVKFSPKFIWPREENPNSTTHPEEEGDLNEPLIDLQPFFDGDEEEIKHITEQVRSACLSNGLFQVINHGVDLELIQSVQHCVKGFFRLPIDQKMKAQTRPGKLTGYSFAHKDRFLSNLPWKETLSCFFSGEDNGGIISHDSDEAAGFLQLAFGEASQQTGWILEDYCKAMKRLSLSIMEILGMSLGLSNQSFYKDFFQDGDCLLRCNFYPPCQEPGLALGTGPHSDPTALTILHQDQVGGLQVLSSTDHKWKTVRPRHNALVVNLGDTFAALANGEYRGCKHRAVVNKSKERVSMVVFLFPKEDKVITPPQDLTEGKGCKQMYPRFTWSDLHYFTHKHYRVDLATLQNFANWIISRQKSPSASPDTSTS